jgi:hypothetical protein
VPNGTTEAAVERFKQRMANEELANIVKTAMFEGTPYVFRDEPANFALLRQHIADGLKVSAEMITVIGSAKLGFSASPDTFARAFTEESDIDVIVVDKPVFDRFWHTLLQWSLPLRGSKLMYNDFKWKQERMEDVYSGWFVPSEIKFDRIPYAVLEPIRRLKTSWFNTFRSLSRYSQFAGRDVNGRLYRSWEHATLYHVDGLRRVQKMLKRI